jgi:predicted nuclease of predicted toxin-antitoxin system
VRLLLDEMWTPAIAEQLRARGHDVEAVATRSDLARAADRALLAAARTEGRAIVTENIRDFRRWAAEAIAHGDGHAGIVLTVPARYPRRGGRAVGRVVDALVALLESDIEMSNREVWL